eukprot:gene12323-15493_t
MQAMIVIMEAVSDAPQQAEELGQRVADMPVLTYMNCLFTVQPMIQAEELRQRVAGKQAESQRLGLDTQVAQERAAIEEIQSRISLLRQVAQEWAAIEEIQSRISLLRQERERVTSANESSAQLKLKWQEIMQRKDAVASLERERVASANESSTQLKLKRQELMQREDAVASLERERVASANESSTRLKLKRQELMQREDAVASLVAGKRSRLIQLLHGDSSRGGSPELPPLDELRPRVERALAEKRQAFSVRGSELKQAQESKANAQASLRSTESQLANVEAQLGRLRNQLRDGMRQSLDTVCEENQYPTLFEESTKALDSKRSKKVKLESSQKLLQHYRDTIAKGSCCPTCNRGFAGANEISASVEFIR